MVDTIAYTPIFSWANMAAVYGIWNKEKINVNMVNWYNHMTAVILMVGNTNWVLTNHKPTVSNMKIIRTESKAMILMHDE